MNNIISKLIYLLILCLLFVVDRALAGTFGVFEYFSFTILFLIILSGLKSEKNNMAIFFMYGLLVDSFGKGFLGFSSLVSVLVAYLYVFVSNKAGSNKLIQLGVSFFMTYFLFIIDRGFDKIFSLEYLIGSIIIAGISNIVWFF